MSTATGLLGLTSGLKPKSIVTGVLKPNSTFGNSISLMPGVQVLSGSCTAATLKTILSITGKGSISFLALASVDSTSRTHRVKITLDGTVIYDSTSAADSTQNLMIVIGSPSFGSQSGQILYGITEHDLLFDSSLVIEYASSLTETDKTKINYIYYTR